MPFASVRHRFSCILSTFLLLTTATALGASRSHVDGIQTYSDSGIDFPPYDKLVGRLETLAKKFPQQAQLIHYGKTVEGRDLTALRLEDTRTHHSEPGRPAIEISGAIHGNEYLGIETELAEHFLEHPESLPGVSLYLSTGGVIYMIPVVNPDGYSNRVRENQHDADLNRDFDLIPTGEKHFTEPETRALAAFLDQDLVSHQLKLRFTMDYHCCVGGLITPWTYKDEHPSQQDLAIFNQVSEWEKQALGYPVGNAEDIVSYLAPGSSIDYFYAKYGTAAFTIEGPYGGEAAHLDKHLAFLDQVFRAMAYHSLGLE